MYEPAGAYWLTMESRSLWSQQDGDNFLNDGYLRYQDEKDLPLESLVAKVGAHLRTPTGGPGSWTDVKPSGSAPAVRFGEALVSLGTGGKVFMFGGATDERHPLGDPWLYDTLADTWSRLTPSGDAPPAHWGAAAVHLPLSRRVVVFGGMGATDVLDDTWVYDVAKNRWFRLSTSSAPSARYRSAITYDPAARKVIMFGGRYSRPGYQQDYSDTWALDVDGQTWTELHPAGDPPDVSAGTAVLVPDRQSTSILLLAGIPPLPPIPPAIPKDELLTLWSAWSYEPKNDVWTSLGTETGSPTISQYYCAAYDSALEQTMVFGGLNLQNGSIGDMWVHEGRGWESPAFGGAGTPQPHIDAGMVFDLDTKRVILFGRSADGTSADVPAQTWAYTP